MPTAITTLAAVTLAAGAGVEGEGATALTRGERGVLRNTALTGMKNETDGGHTNHNIFSRTGQTDSKKCSRS